MMCAPRGTLSGQLRLLVIISLGHFSWTWLHNIPPSPTSSLLACLWIASSLTGSIELLQLQASPSGRKRKTSSTRNLLLFDCQPVCRSLSLSLFLTLSCSDSLSVCSGVRPGLYLCEIGQLHSIETDMWHGRLASCKTIHILIPLAIPAQTHPHCLPLHLPPASSLLFAGTLVQLVLVLLFFFWEFPQRAIFDQVHFS